MLNEKVSGNMNQIREIEYQIQKAKEAVTKAKKDLAESKLAEKSSLARIKQTEEKLRKETRDAEAKKAHFKEQMDASNNIVSKAELQMRKLRKELELKEEEVGMAEAEADQAKGRASDAQAHLNELKAGRHQKLAQLGTRKDMAQSKERKSASLESRARMSAVAVENANDAIAARQDNGMKVSTSRKEVDSKKMLLSKDCNFRDVASAEGRVVQAVHRGQQLVVSQHKGVWMKVHIKGKQDAFVAKTCF
jgi:chromosome segregation ATPase